MAPAIIAKLCVAASPAPWRYTAMPSVASATDGAAGEALGPQHVTKYREGGNDDAANEEANDVFCHFVFCQSLANGAPSPVDSIFVWSTSLEASSG